MPDGIRLRAPSGLVIDYSLPLHETIDGQWRRGELTRVDADGEAWAGDQYDLDGTGTRPASEEEDGPVRPAANAPKAAWQEYAVAAGACTQEEAAGMTRADLIARSTPPELDPLTQE